MSVLNRARPTSITRNLVHNSKVKCYLWNYTWIQNLFLLGGEP
jgi:hypothetical protein